MDFLKVFLRIIIIVLELIRYRRRDIEMRIIESEHRGRMSFLRLDVARMTSLGINAAEVATIDSYSCKYLPVLP